LTRKKKIKNKNEKRKRNYETKMTISSMGLIFLKIQHDTLKTKRLAISGCVRISVTRYSYALAKEKITYLSCVKNKMNKQQQIFVRNLLESR